MARAKRTDRAEARRRYRAEVAEADAAAQARADVAVDSSGQRRPADQSSGTGQSRNQAAPGDDAGRASPSARPGFTAVLRSAVRPWNIRADLAYIPHLVLHTRAVWIPTLATIAAGVYFLVRQPLGSDGIALFLFQLFVVPPTIAGPFLAGVLAPKATYVAGGIASFVAVLVFAFAVLTTPLDSLTLQPTVTPSPVASASAAAGESAAPAASADPASSPNPDTTAPPAVPIDRTAVITQALVLSVPFGVLIGAAGGFYRRFLNLSGANARRREEQRARQARTSGRRK